MQLMKKLMFFFFGDDNKFINVLNILTENSIAVIDTSHHHRQLNK